MEEAAPAVEEAAPAVEEAAVEEAAPAEPAAEEAAPAVPAEDVADPADAWTNPTLAVILATEAKTEEPARKKSKLKSAQIALELPIRVRGFFE